MTLINHEVRSKIEFRNVTFKYETAEKNAVNDLSFVIKLSFLLVKVVVVNQQHYNQFKNFMKLKVVVVNQH